LIFILLSFYKSSKHADQLTQLKHPILALKSPVTETMRGRKNEES
jgi:hypothetical protein